MTSRSLTSMTPLLNTILLALKTIFDTAQDQACKDNAAAALVRIL
jgi:hypothetical protein